ncbi:MAG TPA: pilus assembly protein PilB, partial [Pirellulales bacterium]
MAPKKIGQILIELGFIDEDQLETLLEEQHKRAGELIGQIAIELEMVTDDKLAEALAQQMGMQAISLSEIVISPEVLGYVTEPMANLYKICPIAFRDNTLTIAMCDPQNLAVLDELRNFLGYDIRAVVTTPREIKAALDRYYSSAESVESLL